MEGFSTAFFYLSILLVPGLLFSTIKRFAKWNASDGKIAKPGRFPGPKLFPIVGRVHDLPRFSMWLKFKEWADIYGPIYETRMLDQKFIIISNEKIAADLLIKKGNNFAGRPQIRALINHKAGPVYSALMDRHDIWKNQRKWVHSAMVAAHQHHFFGQIEQEVSRWLLTLLVDPEKFHPNTRELTGRVMSRLAWDDASQGKLNGDTAIITLTQMSVSGPIVNTMSPLWHITDFFRHNPWRIFEEERERNLKAWWRQLLDVSKVRYLRGDLPEDTWTYRFWEQQQGAGNKTLELSEKDLEHTSCMLGFQCLVGVVTLSGPLQFFLMCMMLHPKWQKKCQEEIDRVCGDRMPNVDDMPELPTVRACIKETLRWRSGVPLGVPHQCEKDSEFMGVEIKKGTIILACEWNINRDPEVYPDPENYHPERWLESKWPTYQEPLSRYPNLREGKAMHTFGWGRRTCLGQTIADDELFVAGAAVCWGFNMAPKKCKCTGEDIPVDNQATNSNVILEPKPFPMEFKVRSSDRANKILSNYNDVREILKV